MSEYFTKRKEKSFIIPSKITVCMLHGLLGWGDGPGETEISEAILGSYYNIPSQIDISLIEFDFIYPSLGKLTNIHDQAVDLFFTLVGGPTDYGKIYDTEYNNFRKNEKNIHLRYGSNNNASFPLWSNINKIVFVGHSYGTFVCYYLQYLLKENWFHKNTNYKSRKFGLSEEELNEKAISIIIGINSCLSGSIMPNMLCGPFDIKYQEKSKSELLVKDENTGKNIDFFPFRFSPFRDIGYYIAVFIMITHTLSLKNRLFEFLFSYKITNYSWNVTLLDCLKLNHPIFKYDNALINLSLRGSAELTKNFKLYDDTLYLNFGTNASWYSTLLNKYFPVLGKVFFPWWYLVYKYANGSKNTEDRIWPGNRNLSSESYILDNDLVKNDALVSLLSQIAPFKWCKDSNNFIFCDDIDKIKIYNTEYMPINNSIYQCKNEADIMSITQLSKILNIDNKKYTRRELIKLVKKKLNSKECPSKLNYMNQFKSGNLYIWVPKSDLLQLDHLSVILMVKWRTSQKLFEFWNILFRFVIIYNIDKKFINFK